MFSRNLGSSLHSVFATLAVAACTALAPGANAQVPAAFRANDVKIEKISPSVTPTPEYNISGPGAQQTRPQKWLEIEVEFKTEPKMIDELTFKYEVLFNGKILEGEVTHVNIPDGNNHFSVMYLSPRAIERLLEGKALTGAAMEAFQVTVSRSGQTLATKSSTNRPLPNLQRTKELVNKLETPFQVLWWDRYEAIKTFGR
jgi:hypothetical protein